MHQQRRGYGSACLKALEAIAQDPTPPDAVLFMDADGSDDPDYLPALLAPIAAGEADFVLGSRTRGQAEPGALTFPQRLGSWMMGTYLKHRYGVMATDMGPCRAIRYDALCRLSMDDQDFGWTIQMQTRAATPEAGIRCGEVPVAYRRRQAGKSKISGTLRGSWQAGRIILATAWKERRWRPAPTGHVAVLGKMPQPGRVKTRLAKDIGEEKAAQVHDGMLRHTLGRAAGLPHTLWYSAGSGDGLSTPVSTGNDSDQALAFDSENGTNSTPPGGWDLDRIRRVYGPWRRFQPQPSGALGGRIQAALQDAFDQGHQAAVAVGSDCPDLTAQDLQKALQTLISADADVVLGPANDGGYWLVGVRQGVWPLPALTHDIDWSTPQVFEQTCSAIEKAGLRYKTLRLLSDVDTLEELSIWQQHDPDSFGLEPVKTKVPLQPHHHV